MGTVRAAVVLFVDMDENEAMDARDVAEFTRQGLHQAGFGMHKENGEIPVNFRGQIKKVRLVDVMEVGMAMGNGYLWTEVTSKAFKQRGIYTDKEQQQLIDEILEGSYEEQQMEKDNNV
jgi:hypothetical protein